MSLLTLLEETVLWPWLREIASPGRQVRIRICVHVPAKQPHSINFATANTHDEHSLVDVNLGGEILGITSDIASI